MVSFICLAFFFFHFLLLPSFSSLLVLQAPSSYLTSFLWFEVST